MIKKAYFSCAILLFFMLVLHASPQETILIKNGTIVPVVGNVVKNGSLLIQNGKIAKIGTDITAPADAKVIDAQGMFVYPGLIAPFTAIGVTGYPGAGNDTDELGVSTPHVDPYDAINPEDETIEVTRVEGITTVITVSGSRNVLNGKSVALNLEGDIASDMVIKKYVAQIFNIGVKRQNQYPTTHPGNVAFIKDKLNKAKYYAEKKKKGDEKTDGSFKIDLELEALVPVIKGEVIAFFVTNDEPSLRNALHIIKEYKLKGIIYANGDILKFVDQLAAAKVPIIWAGTATIPERWQPFDMYYHTAAILKAKNILFAFNHARRGPESRNMRNLPTAASLSVVHGLSEEEAIKAMTINTAKILGIDDQVGSLEVGKTANVAIWTGSPIQRRARTHCVIINGKIIPRTSYQIRLIDKFDKIVRERMKKKKN